MALAMGALGRFGITRVADQTALDTIGIPCYAAIRPNARTLAVNQGKGADDDRARLSAIMEGIEFAVAEAPTASRTMGSIEELERDGRDIYVPARSLPKGHVVEVRGALTWLTGRSLGTGEPVLLPLDSVALSPNATERLPFSQSSNGLGAGFAWNEAVVHALCELVERDAYTVWSLRSSQSCTATELTLKQVSDPEARRCIQLVLDRGFKLKLFDLTSDLGLPVAMALLWSGTPRSYFDVASGMCAHPSSGRALAGAIEEAAQTRISNIAGARDDISPEEYNRPLPGWIARLVDEEPPARRRMTRSMSEHEFSTLPERVGGRIAAVRLSSPDDEIVVVKLVSEILEDRSTNAHWRPGARAIRAMTGP